MDEINIPLDDRTIQDDIIDAYRAARGYVVDINISWKYAMGDLIGSVMRLDQAFFTLFLDTRFNESIQKNPTVGKLKIFFENPIPKSDEEKLRKYINDLVDYFEEYTQILYDAGMLPIDRKG